MTRRGSRNNNKTNEEKMASLRSASNHHDGGQRKRLPGPPPATSLEIEAKTVRQENTKNEAYESYPCSIDTELYEEVERNRRLDRQTAPFNRTRAALAEWQKLTDNKVVHAVIEKGVRIPLLRTPMPQKAQARGPVDQELERLLKMGVLRKLTPKEVKATKAWTPIFGVLKKGSNKTRLITDLRGLNSCTTTPKFQMPSWQELVALVEKAHFACILDIEEFFFHFRLAKNSSRWVRMAPGLECNALPFGLASSPYWCARMTRPILEKLRAEGVCLHWYVDDILITGCTANEVKVATTKVIRILTKLGFALNLRKSKLEPQPVADYLGLLFDLKERTIDILDEKKTLLQKEAHALMKARTTPKSMASFAGRVNYYSKGHASLHGWHKPLMREAARSASAGWKKKTNTPTTVKKIAAHLKNELQTTKPQQIPALSKTPTGTLYTDASPEGWGAVWIPNNLSPSTHTTTPTAATTTSMNSTMVTAKKAALTTITAPQEHNQAPKRHKFAGRWTERQSEMHITTKEMFAVKHGLSELVHNSLVSEGDCIQVLTDSVAARAALLRGSASYKLNWAANAAKKVADQHKISLIVDHVRGSSNPADEPSRQQREREDYKLKRKWLNMAAQKFQLKHLANDLFVVRHNTNVKKWFAKRKEPNKGCMGANALAQNWNELDGVLYANPLFSMMSNVLQKAERDRVQKLILVAPVWRAAPWWSHLERLSKAAFNVPKTEPVYVQDGNKHVPPPNWRTTIRHIQVP
eukprot:TRINITY_DN2499_c1_g1_i3.p1 TRINITY_DN2499_c1_g1~~TRINITY_DN2499_c1_g1_i3.p1  ORF type:complete len:753 (+),score=80.31 TRINITY_DN2499_c1_g1_i3:700-2958(+)